MQMNKNGQIGNIIQVIFVSVLFFASVFILGKAELENGLLSNFVNSAQSSLGTMDKPVNFVFKLIIPAIFVFSFIFYIMYIRGVMIEA